MALSAGADNEFAEATLGVGPADGILRCEAFVVVVVSGDDEFRIVIVKSLIKRCDRQIVAVIQARTEAWLVQVSNRTGGVMLGQVLTQPFFLRRTGLAAADFLAFRIQNDNVPGTKFVTVVAGLGIACGRAKIPEIVS